MNSTRKYITSELKKRMPMFIALLILAGMIALNVAVPEPKSEPDSVHPFVNTQISWEQTFYEGPWGDTK
ncbi:MAG: hypothetical protein IKG23_00470 [Clostridia bacterium]|nr:hypothetical protein [Clostridia bacterium]